MKINIKLRLVFLLVFGLCLLGMAEAAEYEPFAVVELFTSEGCSSCPPADAFLREITELARTKDQRIYALGFHVDYWNYLGWKDPFSSNRYTTRQHGYARALQNSTVYTPQIVINGQLGMSGNQRSEILGYLKAALLESASVGLEISLEQMEEQLLLRYHVADAPERSFLQIAIVEDDLSNNVIDGENAGQVLYHDGVVRIFKSVVLKRDEGRVKINIPSFVDLRNASLIAYVQNSQNMSILAAKRINDLLIVKDQ